VNQFDPDAYGPVFARLTEIDRRRPLDAGVPDPGARKRLEALSVEEAFAQTTITDRGMAACCLAAVWLLHDYLDDSHALSQQIETPSGSFWHGIMHRREGDFSNAKYWFRRVGRHAAFDGLSQRAAEIAAVRGEERALKKLITGGAWDACAFVDLCESVVRGNGSSADLCLDIQQAEWELLFDHCYAAAVGR
jgi:hypothetical protein